MLYKNIDGTIQKTVTHREKKRTQKEIKMKREKKNRVNTHIYKRKIETFNFIKQDGKWKIGCEYKTIGDYLGISEHINLDDLRRLTIKWK